MMTYSAFRRARILTQDLVMGSSLGVASGIVFGWVIERVVQTIDSSAPPPLITLGIAVGAVAGAAFGVVAGKAFTLPKTAVRVGFETDSRAYGKAALRTHSTVAAILAAYALFPKHGLFGAVVGALAGCIGGLLGIIFTFVFIFTIGMVLTKLVDVVFNFMEKHAATTLFSVEGLRERAALEHYNKGMRLDRENRISDAINEYTIAVELLPDFPQAVHNLAFDRGATGDVQREISGYLEAIRLKPDYELAITNLVTTYKDKGRVDDARQWEERLGRLKDKLSGQKQSRAT